MEIVIFFAFILLIILLIALVKAFIEYRKYGIRIFNAFKPKKIEDTRDELLGISLERITWYRKIIRIKRLKSDYILVDGNGITIFKIFTDVGSFNGTNTSKYIYYSTGGQEYRKPSPIISLNEDEKIISKILPKVRITKYLVLTDLTYVSIQNPNFNQIRFSKIPYALREDNQYSNGDIDNMAKELSKIV